MDDELERMLDAGIASYGAAEPLAGLERRILARVAAADGAPKRKAAVWRGALAAAAFMAVAIMIWPHERPPVARPVEFRVVTPDTESAPVVNVAGAVRPVRRIHRMGRAARLPKLEVFPTPSPMTPEERRLMAMVKADPEGAAKTFEALRARGAEIEIAPLEIKPLESGDGQ